MSESKPTTRQLAYLRALAQRTGQTFSTPATRTQASSEIRRLKRQQPLTGAELAVERARNDRDRLAYGTAPHADEIRGYGSQATWRTGS